MTEGIVHHKPAFRLQNASGASYVSFVSQRIYGYALAQQLSSDIAKTRLSYQKRVCIER